MLTDSKLKAQVDQLWNMFWSGGLSNPLDAIEQLSYLIFFKRMQEEEDRRQRIAELDEQTYTSRLPNDVRWDAWRNLPAKDALKQLREKVFPWFRDLADEESSLRRYMQGAECKISEPSLLIQACNLIEQMQISAQNLDIQGDLYEYLLSKLSTPGRNGQFRTPRHIIRLMVKMVDPKPHDRTGDLAAGTAGFLVNVYLHLLETNTSPALLSYDDEGMPHNAIGNLLTAEQRHYLQTDALHGFDGDSGMTMLRIDIMNLMLHGIESPNYQYANTLGADFNDTNAYTLLLMNPPFKGALNPETINETLPDNTTKTELLFLHLILRALDMGGRCAVIVPDGVLFGSSNAHKAIRKKIIEENRLDGVISMPGGVFKPYAGVSTAILLFTKGAKTADEIWFYDMEHDGFSLDDKRVPIAENDVPDILTCWGNRHNSAFAVTRQARLAELQTQVAPLKTQWLQMQAEINRLTFECAIAPEGEESAAAALAADKAKVETLQAQIAPLQMEINQLSRQFWVKKKDIQEHGYDLSASCYRQGKQDEAYYEKVEITAKRLMELEKLMILEINELNSILVSN